MLLKIVIQELYLKQSLVVTLCGSVTVIVMMQRS